MSRFTHILAATDGSPLATMALGRAVTLAADANAALTIVTVSEPLPTFDTGEIGWSLPADALTRIRDDDAARSRAILKAAAASAHEHGIAARTVHVPDQGAAQGIIETARTSGADLIVMASHGRRGFNRLLLGSQAAKVLALSDVAVLIAKPPHLQPEA